MQVKNKLGVLFLLAAFPLSARAALVKCAGLGCLVDPDRGGLTGLLSLPVEIFNLLVSMSALVLMGVIVWAGIRMMLYHLSESPEAELSAAKLTLTRGLFGFFIVVAAYLIVHTFIYFVLGLSDGPVKVILDVFKL